MYCRSLVSWFGLTMSDWYTAGTTPRRTMSTTIQTAIVSGHHWCRRQMFQTSTAASSSATARVT